MQSLAAIMRRRWSSGSCSKVQILSDLHLEVGQQYTCYTFPVTAPKLLLAGDIGRLIDYDGYLAFLKAQVLRFERIFLVLGNHEFYGSDYQSGIQAAERLAREPSLADRLILLNCNRWDDPDSSVTIIGCTLWSAIPDHLHEVVQYKISDSKKIVGWSSHKHHEVHLKELAWLREQIDQIDSQPGPKRKILVATHHAPRSKDTSRPRDSSNPWTCAFASDIFDQYDWPGVRVWMFGHTHYSVDMRRSGIRLVANQRGYVLPGVAEVKVKKDDKKASTFDAARFITI